VDLRKLREAVSDRTGLPVDVTADAR